MMDFGGALSSVAQALSLVKSIREIDKGYSQAELKARMADLYSMLADIKMTLSDARDDVREKEQVIATLLKNFEFRGTLVEAHGFKYEAFEDGGPKGEPFCPRCEQNLGKYYRLNQYGGLYDLECPECKTKFRATAYVWERS